MARQLAVGWHWYPIGSFPNIVDVSRLRLLMPTVPRTFGTPRLVHEKDMKRGSIFLFCIHCLRQIKAERPGVRSYTLPRGPGSETQSTQSARGGLIPIYTSVLSLTAAYTQYVLFIVLMSVDGHTFGCILPNAASTRQYILDTTLSIGTSNIHAVNSSSASSAH